MQVSWIIFGSFVNLAYFCGGIATLIGRNGMMRLVHYNSREEMIAAYRKAKQRKREWMEEQERDFQRIKDSLKAKPICYENA